MLMRKIFPEVRFNLTKRQQFNKILDELLEVDVAIHNNDRIEILEETIDLMHTTANLLYSCGYTDSEIKCAIDYVKLKNEKRGYYK